MYEDGTVVRPNGSIATTYLSTMGYYIVNLYYEGRQHTHSIHALLGELFLEKPEGAKYVIHKDGNKTNNSLSNLEWSSKRTGENKTRVICSDGMAYESISDATTRGHISYNVLRRCLTKGTPDSEGRTWKKI